jgi:hypothetical protein
VKHTCSLIAAGMLSLLAGSAGRAETTVPHGSHPGVQRGRPTSSRRVEPRPADGSRAAARVTALSRPAPSAAAVAHARVLPAPLAARNAPARSTDPVAAPHTAARVRGNAVRHPAAVNAVLGGPATYDARKLVRR